MINTPKTQTYKTKQKTKPIQIKNKLINGKQHNTNTQKQHTHTHTHTPNSKQQKHTKIKLNNT